MVMTSLQRPSRRGLGAAAVGAALLACTVAAPAAEAMPSRTVCVPFTVTGVGQDLGGGRTEAVLSAHGRRIGTTTASFTPTNATGGFEGPLTFVPDRVPGSPLTAELQGTLDATGAFSATSTSLSGKGQLQRVTGSLRVNGVVSADGSFTETLVGQLCTLPSRLQVIERIVG